VHPHISLVVGLRLTSVERNREHDLGFVVTGPDGSEVTTASGKVVAHGPVDPNDIVLNIAIDLWNLNLKVVGEHAVRVTIDGSERKRLPLMVAVSLEGTPSAPEQRYLA
jgi:hypothetical protein